VVLVALDRDRRADAFDDDLLDHHDPHAALGECLDPVADLDRLGRLGLLGMTGDSMSLRDG